MTLMSVGLKNCIWKEDGDDFESYGIYFTGCGEAFQISNDEGLDVNKFKYCTYCGKKIVEEKWQPDNKEV
jgi:rRNA maturation endonuclease Nob1